MPPVRVKPHGAAKERTMPTPDQAEATMMRNLEEKTGKTLDEWIAIARATGQNKHGEVVKILKERHGLGHGYANLVVHRMNAASKAASGSGEADLVEEQYAGLKAGLRPVYDALIRTVEGFGNDVEVSPKKTYVSLRRSKQFALIQPSTKDRVDLGIQLKGVAAEGRLESSGSFNAMVSHRVRLGGVQDVDAQLRGWLKQAYDAS
jgi:hypothetical protein